MNLYQYIVLNSKSIFCIVALRILVLDMYMSLMWSGVCVQSLAVIKKLQPKRAFLIGMTHEFEHELDSRILAEWSARCSF